ncbi:SDR family oxidoreductase [Shewanella amazonensis]|uniref:3-oxoacyl-[acyl-carrier-protein] reductase n=1 Tax=Shewanella amazonensis (strain ATCC BAA-1098 / SB2B) TaxID=326297 RepID=A1S7U9_SHEAM|nr:SDR family oxidoreductase [Shewanella amazonensis]ABM00456.1 3-oxoacyl-[acyl-carrier-protein] reductase [Shewanella amazonensis SB2B]
MNTKAVVVTGATGGIGWTIAEYLMSLEYFVIGTTHRAPQSACEQWIEMADKRGVLIKYDSNVDNLSIDTLIEVANGHSIYGLVNNLGITRDSSFKKMTSEQWKQVMDVNLFSVFSLTQCIFNHMALSGSGRIVNISSVNAHRGQFGQVNYCAAKAGLLGFTKALSLEGAKSGITVNSVSPGYTDTKMLSHIPTDILQSIKDSVPMKRLAKPIEIAHAVAFLLDDKSAYITGADIPVNGGLHLS